MIEELINKRLNANQLKKHAKKIELIRKIIAEYKAKPDLDLAKTMLDIRNSKLDNNTKICHAMALADLASEKTQQKNYYDVQFMGGLTLSEGKVAEMKTGEGKTLMCSLGVAANFVLGFKVHVATANEYLAKRDQETLVELYNALGIKSSYNISKMDKPAKRIAYEADVMYSTATEKGFDYLRDNLVLNIKDKVQPLDFLSVAAIIDEADFILIDEARTPLIISGESESHPPSFYQNIRDIALKLTPMESEPQKDLTGKYIYQPGDYWIEWKTRGLHVSEEGYDSLEKVLREFNLLGDSENLYVPANAWIIEQVQNALRAEKLYIKDKQYVVHAGEIIIIDENTGRLSQGRRWSDGLHQAIEAKEKIEVQPENSTTRSITIQNFYRNYGKISGMTGTAYTCATEFLDVYNTPVVVIPPNKPLKRIDMEDQVYLFADRKYKAIIQDVISCHEKQQPILIATTSVVESELISGMLNEAKIFHHVLNAKNHALEAQIVAQAGIAGSVTVSTSMAGRGTDIILGGNQEEIVVMREKQITRVIGLRNAFLNMLFQKGAIQKGESLEFPPSNRFNWNNLVVLEDFINQSAKIIDYSEPTTPEKDRSILTELVHLEVFLNRKLDEIKNQWQAARDKAVAAGGLYVLGCSRNESRRIDDQIKGRAGRQGDVGRNCFYMSLEDPWLNHFGESRVITMVKNMTLKMERDDIEKAEKEGREPIKGDPLQMPMLTKAIFRAQQSMENLQRESRKNTVKFDSVLNEARIEFFSLRDRMISGDPILKTILMKEIKDDLQQLLDFDFTETTQVSFKDQEYSVTDLLDILYMPETSNEDKQQIILNVMQKTLNIEWNSMPEFFSLLYAQGLDELIKSNSFKNEENIVSKFDEMFDKLFAEIPEELWNFYQYNCLSSLDKSWITFLDITDEIKDSSSLSSFAQKNPVYVYKTACFDIFEDLILEFKNNLINILMDSKMELDEMAKEQVQRMLRENAEKALLEQRQQQLEDNLADPSLFILDINPNLIFTSLIPEAQRMTELADPSSFEVDIDPSQIFQEVTV